jgi:hypothetical protein
MPDGHSVVSRNYDEHAHWEVLNELVGQIYECALDPSLWNETLSHITAALCPLSWEAAFLLWEGHNPPRAEFIATSGLAGGVQEMYTAVYAGKHPWSQRLANYRNGSVVDSDELMSRREFAETSFARDFLIPWGIDRMVAVMLDGRRGGERLGLMLPGPGERDLNELKRGMRVLAPHIQRAVRISHRIASLELAAGAAVEATDQAPFAVLSLDADLGILSANRRVAIYERAGVISTAQQRLVFSHPAAQQKLIELARIVPPAGLAFQALDAKGRTSRSCRADRDADCKSAWRRRRGGVADRHNRKCAGRNASRRGQPRRAMVRPDTVGSAARSCHFARADAAGLCRPARGDNQRDALLAQGYFSQDGRDQPSAARRDDSPTAGLIAWRGRTRRSRSSSSMASVINGRWKRCARS